MEETFTAHGITIYQYVMPAILSNMYLILEGRQALVIDPNTDAAALARLKEAQPDKVTILLTHEHFDHISGVNLLRQNFAVEVICLKACADMLGDPSKNFAKFWRTMIMDKPLEIQKEGWKVDKLDYTCAADTIYGAETVLPWAGHKIKLTPAPGHSKGGSLFLLDGNILFSGDNLVEGAGVICRFPGGSKKDYTAITRPMLEALPDDTFVCPGHGKPKPLGDLRQYMRPFDIHLDRGKTRQS